MTKAEIGPVLITGCSGGIGRTTCERLIASGHIVYASARRLDALAGLSALGCHTLQLDVTDETSMQNAVDAIEKEHGRVGVLVNNAGYGVYGPTEQLAIDELRAEFETNVFGLTRLTQMVLPKMRAHKQGRIVNISSLAGRATFPGGAFYHASKYALEGLSDSLRIEVVPFGIKVILIEPGPVDTGWAPRAAEAIPVGVEGEEDPYEQFKISVATMLMGRDSGAAKRVNAPADHVAQAIERAIDSAHPRTRYVVGAATKAMLQIRRWLPDVAYDALMRNRFHLP